MKARKPLLVALALVILGLVLLQPVKAGLQSQQDQIGITIIVNVSPSPLAYVPHQAPGASNVIAIASRLSLDRATPPLQRVFEAQNLRFERSSAVTVAQVQKPLLVQAEVSPNPKATLLISNFNNVTLSQTAGTTVAYPCAFTVTVNHGTSSWSLDQGLSNDFASSFSGMDLGNNVYVSTPRPTATPYLVYADDGSTWALAGSGSTITTYCVSLTLTVPGTVTAGTYSSNAIYTLFF